MSLIFLLIFCPYSRFCEIHLVRLDVSILLTINVFWDSFWDIVKLPQNRLVVLGLTFNLCYEGSWQLIFFTLCVFVHFLSKVLLSILTAEKRNCTWSGENSGPFPSLSDAPGLLFLWLLLSVSSWTIHLRVQYIPVASHMFLLIISLPSPLASCLLSLCLS